MRNLLTQKDKKVIVREYKLRIMIIVLTAIFITALIASALLLPSYILSNFKYNIVKEHSDFIKKSLEKRERDAPGSILNDTQEKLKLLSVSEDNILFSEMLEMILNKKLASMKIEELFYRKKQNESGEIIVRGVASNRESLLQFKKDLETEDVFSKVILPISNLALDKDIKFSINIIGKF